VWEMNLTRRSEEHKGKKEKEIKPRQTDSYSTFTHFLETRNGGEEKQVEKIEEKKEKKEGSFLSILMRKYSSDDAGSGKSLICY
jgi:hypothetical protein